MGGRNLSRGAQGSRSQIQCLFYISSLHWGHSLIICFYGPGAGRERSENDPSPVNVNEANPQDWAVVKNGWTGRLGTWRWQVAVAEGTNHGWALVPSVLRAWWSRREVPEFETTQLTSRKSWESILALRISEAPFSVADGAVPGWNRDKTGNLPGKFLQPSAVVRLSGLERCQRSGH